MYAVAVFGNRAIAFLNVLLIAYLLDQESFGLYTLLSSNALLLQLIAGSWASASVSKYMPIAESRDRFAPLSTALIGLLLLAAIEVVATLAYVAFPTSAVPPIYVVVVVGWSLALIVYEVTLAAQNALGLSKAYAIVALSRNSLALILSLSAAWCGMGVIGAAIGQIIGTLLPSLALPSSFAVWRQVALRSGSLDRLRQQVIFGVGGLVASGLYVLFSTSMRNIVVVSHGKAATGHLSLSCDLFFVPLALIVNVLFLAKMPQLYILSASPERHGERLIELRTIARGLAALIVPFLVAGALIADRLIAAVLPGDVGASIAPLAPAAAVFGGSFALLYATCMMLLIFDYRLWLLITAIGTVAANVVLQAFLPRSTTLPELLYAASAVVLVSGLLTTWRFLNAEQGIPRSGFLAKVAAASVLMGLMLLATRWLPLLATPLAVPLGLIVYGALLWRLGAFDQRDVRYFRHGDPAIADPPARRAGVS